MMSDFSGFSGAPENQRKKEIRRGVTKQTNKQTEIVL